eukprot:414484_1
MDVGRQCLGCGSIYDKTNKLVSLPTKQNHQCSTNHSYHTGPWIATQINGYHNGVQQNQYIHHQQQQQQYHHQQPQPQQQQQQQQQQYNYNNNYNYNNANNVNNVNNA